LVMPTNGVYSSHVGQIPLTISAVILKFFLVISNLKFYNPYNNNL
jgi:hypothetical protein